MLRPTEGTPEHLHYLLTHFILRKGHAPKLEQLARLAGQSVERTAKSQHQLEEMHGVILEPGTSRVWSLHPFALIPTAFWVSSKGRGWWANCAWCALGIGAALKKEVRIVTRDGAEGDPLEFTVDKGRASLPHLLMHFPFPPAMWWENPYCPCGNILFFSSEKKIEEWCERHGRPKGAVLSMEKALALAEAWFGDYASPKWRRKTPRDAAKIFEELDLDSEFWKFPDEFR